MKALRSEIPDGERRRRSAEIARRLLALPAIERAGTVLAFTSFGSEVSTEELLPALAEPRRRIVLPYLEGGRLEATVYRPGDPTIPTRYGAREPASRVPVDPASLDAVIVPGLAFDREGYRVGYGGGYFDGYLARVAEGTTTVGVAFHEQVVDEAPHGPRDVPVDLLVTDREVIVCRPPPA